MRVWTSLPFRHSHFCHTTGAQKYYPQETYFTAYENFTNGPIYLQKLPECRGGSACILHCSTLGKIE
jgi:hypothetical protein